MGRWRGRRGVGTALIAGLLAAGCTAGTTDTTSPVADPPAIPTEQEGCPASGLQVSIGMHDAALGLRAAPLVVENCGDALAFVEGYPDVRLLDGAREPIDLQATPGASMIVDPGPVRVSLPAGERAQSWITWRSWLLAEDDRTPLVVGHLAVATPGSDERQVVALDADLGTTELLQVTAWEPVGGPDGTEPDGGPHVPPPPV